MKVFIILAAVAVSCATASQPGGYGARTATYGPVGTSSQFLSQDNYGNYRFGYDETHDSGSSGRHEERSGDVVHGSYNLGVADGRQRTVSYVADGAGFRATVHTNEPGVDTSRNPAAVHIKKEGYAAPAPVAAYQQAAPVHRTPVYQASAPRTFGYLFDTSHPALSYASPAPVYAASVPLYRDTSAY